jgi:hypothetical protein
MHPSSILDDVKLLCGVSERLDLLAGQHTVVSEAPTVLSRGVCDSATSLEVLVETKVAPVSGLAGEQHGEDQLHKTAAAAVPEPKAIGYGMPCAKCHAYYTADLKICPICASPERVSPTAVPVLRVVPSKVTPNAGVSRRR